MKRKLTPTYINKLKPKATEYLVSDGDNLYLAIKPNNTKLWVFLYTSPVTNKRRKTSFKSYPNVSIQSARKRAKEYHELLFKGIDPIDYKQQKEALLVTFNVTFKEWLLLERKNVTLKVL